MSRRFLCVASLYLRVCKTRTICAPRHFGYGHSCLTLYRSCLIENGVWCMVGGPRGIASSPQEENKLPLFQRFKQMYKDYWYVLVPVHLVTSLGWFVGFYYLAESGIDLSELAKTLHLSEAITEKLKEGSKTGYLAIAYALYKVATPLRYTVTLGGTTISINYLRKWGYIKPSGELRKMYRDKRKELSARKKEFKS